MTIFHFCNLLILSPICQEPGSPELKQKDRILDLQFNQGLISNIGLEWCKTERVHISSFTKKIQIPTDSLGAQVRRFSVWRLQTSQRTLIFSYVTFRWICSETLSGVCSSAALTPTDKCQAQIKVVHFALSMSEDKPIPHHLPTSSLSSPYTRW